MTAWQGWARDTLRDFGWRDLALASGLALLLLFAGPRGGYFLIPLHEGVNPLFDPGKHHLLTFFRMLLGQALPFVLAARMAERAIDGGVAPWRAYSLILLTVLLCPRAFDQLPLPMINRQAQHIGRVYWAILLNVMQWTAVVSLYALWRTRERSMRRVQASESARARDRQRLQSAQLLALQARVDPQLLFDTLRQVGRLQRSDPPAADALLGDLIAMLRATLPRAASTGSTVEREFAVVEAWLKVRRALSAAGWAVNIEPTPALAGASLAPLLLQPLVRSVLESAGAAAVDWRLGAEAAGDRLLVTLAAQPAGGAGDGDAARLLADVDLASLRARLALLHGGSARLRASLEQPPRLVLDLPLSIDPAPA
jgi:hypothetical protein